VAKENLPQQQQQQCCIIIIVALTIPITIAKA
jgi:hypothetical protein